MKWCIRQRVALACMGSVAAVSSATLGALVADAQTQPNVPRVAMPTGKKYPQARIAFPKLGERPKDMPPVSELILRPETVSRPLYPVKAFDVRYSLKGPKTNAVCRFVSDGAGRLRAETAGLPFIHIIDYPNKTWTTLNVQRKVATRVKWASPEGVMRVTPVLDTAGAMRVNAQLAGQKIVLGRQCRGYTYTAPGSRNELWIADGIDVVIESTGRTPQGKLTTTMQSYSPVVDPTEFNVPTGYRIETPNSEARS